MRILEHIKKLDDCSGLFLVYVTCTCGASRTIHPEALARIVDGNTRFDRAENALFPVREEASANRSRTPAQASRRTEESALAGLMALVAR
jgi:hypothetical protein